MMTTAVVSGYRRGVVNETTINNSGLQGVLAGGSATDTTVNSGGGQSVHGQASDTTLDGGTQWVHSGGITSGTIMNKDGAQLVKAGAQATGSVVNTGAEGGPDARTTTGSGLPVPQLIPPLITMVVRLLPLVASLPAQ